MPANSQATTRPQRCALRAYRAAKTMDDLAASQKSQTGVEARLYREVADFIRVLGDEISPDGRVLFEQEVIPPKLMLIIGGRP